jgi:hypothetical protein
MKETDGDKVWYMNGQYHREDGPAIEFADGDMEWWLNGQLHREDGPAIEWVNDHSDGGKEWYIHGKKLSEEEHSSETTLVKSAI